MKILLFFLGTLNTFLLSGKERTYVGSTPADPIVRSFLEIPLSDSVDFIRWEVTIRDGNSRLRCNYGIGKPNTPGFWNGGKWIELNGKLIASEHYYCFVIGNRTLNAIELNPALLHLADENKKLLTGNSGYSYALSNVQTSASDAVHIISKQELLKDSMAYEGRTLCGDFSVHPPSPNCIKMKWSIIFYANAVTNTPTTYLLNPNRSDAGKKGTWKIITGKDGRILYELLPENGNSPTYLLKLDDTILWFTDARGNLLVGNEDFSFALNRKRRQ